MLMMFMFVSCRFSSLLYICFKLAIALASFCSFLTLFPQSFRFITPGRSESCCYIQQYTSIRLNSFGLSKLQAGSCVGKRGCRDTNTTFPAIWILDARIPWCYHSGTHAYPKQEATFCVCFRDISSFAYLKVIAISIVLLGWLLQAGVMCPLWRRGFHVVRHCDMMFMIRDLVLHHCRMSIRRAAKARLRSI